MGEIRIICVRKTPGAATATEPTEADYAAIESFGWLNEESKETGEMSREALWTWIGNGGRAFVRAPAGHVAYLRALTGNNWLRYVQTYADQTPTEHLLHLPPC